MALFEFTGRSNVEERALLCLGKCVLKKQKIGNDTYTANDLRMLLLPKSRDSINKMAGF